MNDNREKLDDLESKMNVLEQTLNEIKEAIKENKKKTQDENSDGNWEQFYLKELALSEVKRKKIRNILDNFDFKKVHDVMNLIGWKWAFAKNGIPEIDELKLEAHRLLIDACTEETNVSTGGFRAVYEDDEKLDEEPYVGLEFIVEECEGFTDDED